MKSRKNVLQTQRTSEKAAWGRWNSCVGWLSVGGLGLRQRTATIVLPYSLGRLLVRPISGQMRRVKNSQIAKNNRRRSRRSNPSSLRRFDPAAASTALIASPHSRARKHRPIR